MTAKVANNWPVAWRQDVQWHRADFNGKDVSGREKVVLKRPQWQEAWRWMDGQVAVMAAQCRQLLLSEQKNDVGGRD